MTRKPKRALSPENFARCVARWGRDLLEQDLALLSYREAVRTLTEEAQAVVASLGGLCRCGAPEDGHFPDCQPASRGGTVPDMEGA